MSVLQDLRVMEMLASRICHDIISPVGAINNGVELMQEMGAQVGEEAVKLIGHSAEQASRRLKLFRLCYGSAGSDTNLTVDDVLMSCRDYLSGSRVTLAWDSGEVKKIPGQPRGTAKVLLNLAIIAAESMVHGGLIEVKAEAESPQFRLIANGRGAGLRTDAWAPLAGEVAIDDLTAKSIHPHITGRFADHYGLTIGHAQPQDDRLELTLAFTPVVA